MWDGLPRPSGRAWKPAPQYLCLRVATGVLHPHIIYIVQEIPELRL
jgi:hypothetical protein